MNVLMKKPAGSPRRQRPLRLSRTLRRSLRATLRPQSGYTCLRAAQVAPGIRLLAGQFSFRQIATEIGASPAYVCRLVSGERKNPSWDFRHRLEAWATRRRLL
jgi:hypothetical protein